MSKSAVELLEIGPRVTALPVLHGSGDFAWEIRRRLLRMEPDCLAIPLPASFLKQVTEAVLQLPQPAMVVQRPRVESETWREQETDDSDGDPQTVMGELTYVPIDPCQPVIAAIRVALEEHIPIRFIDRETNQFHAVKRTLPDAYALKKVSLEQYAAAVLPFLDADENDEWRDRIRFMAGQLRHLSLDFRNIAFVTGILDWPFIRQAFQDPELVVPESESVEDPEVWPVDGNSLYFLFGELPYITGLYERARAQLDDDSTLTIDGVKQLLLQARSRYLAEHRNRSRKITSKLLAQCLQYTRNLTLIERFFTPQLLTIVTAAKQIAGDGFAIQVLETAKDYGIELLPQVDPIKLGIQRLYNRSLGQWEATSRLPGPPIAWSRLELTPRPSSDDQKKWKQQWNPYSQCSWPPEDERIEQFRQTVFDRAREAMGTDLARTEKFTSSIQDGIDIRDTLRNWHTGDLYVRILPPNQGKLDAAVMLFDSPADPRDYPWRTTWFAEHANESTLAFFATAFENEPVGPGICLANYGGSLFLYPPVTIADIWQDPRLDYTDSLEERLLAAACLHSRCKHIALLSSAPPGLAWKRLAKQYGKSWVHLPLSRFSDSTVQQLRMVHVLNGRDVRSYAAQFIRRV